MSEALKGVEVTSYTPPSGVVNVGGEWYYEEFGPGRGVHGLGLQDPWPGAPAAPVEYDPNTNEPIKPPVENTDRRSILDLFRN
jgi:penicillin-binding protein 1A